MAADLRAVAEADVVLAGRVQMADAGPRRVLETLHPPARLVQNALSVDTTCPPSEGGARDHGMVLVPCAFAWPCLRSFMTPGRTPTL